ncbi:YdcF family protein [Ancylobacter sp. A5.8]|uniref:YdcF family protein n=1 Tax=Ancylobacter gelatini TaxID=2919920 RepID=UPI001F4E22FD|nr:YdcF family protein [Ancylobacter gelatini]MCJ8141477.1 YdcF family protein [Ancylobacter gelatini]
MFFQLSKIFWAIAVPSTFLTIVAVLGLVLLLCRLRRVGLALICAGLLGLVVFGLGPPGRALTVPLENRFPSFVDDGLPVHGVVVLGGGELPLITQARGQASFQEAGERITTLADLARRYPDAKIVFSGGSGELVRETRLSEADVVRMALPQLGIPVERVTFEDRSRNTAENAAFSRDLVAPKPGERWLLVTSAYHMPRAMGCFRVADFDVTAYPVDFRTTGHSRWTEPFRNVAEGLAFTDLAVREWVGLAVYYLTGRTNALMPAP